VLLNKFLLKQLFKCLFSVIIIFMEPYLLLQVSNAYLQLRGSDTKMQFEFVKDMPRAAQPEMTIDISFLVGKVIFVWMIMLLFPV
jgi:hypothetical protein